MKKCFLFIVASLLISCGNVSSLPNSEEYEKINISEIVNWDYETNKSLYDGKKVILDGVVITSLYGNYITLGDYDGDSESGFSNVVALEAYFESKVSFAWKDIVDVKGIVSSKNGRCVLLGEEIAYDKNEEESKGQGKIITYSLYGRSGYESIDNKSYIGVYFRSTFELVDKFDFVNGDYDFQVVYPGEKYQEPFLIDCYIPQTITEDEKNAITTIFSSFKRGDTLEMRGQIYYDDKLCLFFSPQVFQENLFNKVESHNIYDSWNEVNEQLSRIYETPFPALISNNIWTYVVDDVSYFESRNIVSITIYSSNLDEDFDNYYISIIKEGWKISNEISNQYTATLTSNNLTIGSLTLKKFNTHLRLLINGVNIDQGCEEFNSFEEVIQALNKKVINECSFVNQEWESRLSIYLPYEYKIIFNYQKSLINRDEEIGVYELTFTFKDYLSLDAIMDDMIMSFYACDFVDLGIASLNEYGYFNFDSNEFIVIEKDLENNQIKIIDYIFSSSSTYYPQN